MRLASLPRDISITVCDSAILMTTSLPWTLHSPADNMETRMRWLLSVSACRTATCSFSIELPASEAAVVAAVSPSWDCGSGAGGSGATAVETILATVPAFRYWLGIALRCRRC